MPATELFRMGHLIATANFNATMERMGLDSLGVGANLLARHASGDWGLVDEEDAKENRLSLKHNLRLMSVYDVRGVKVWVITEADRSSTTILLPEDY